MKNTLKGYLIGVLSTVLLLGGVAYAANNTKTIEAFYNNIKIYVDGVKINPADANGKTVEPFIYKGTTYLPVRAVADALKKEVYWDGPNYTVYLGNMNGKLKFPTKYITDLTNIGDDKYKIASGDDLTDNYGNRYSDAIQVDYNNSEIEFLLDMKYSRFKATLYRPKGAIHGTRYIKIIADGKTIYTSPELDKTSKPVDIDVNVTGCNDFKIQFFTTQSDGKTTLGNVGFYQ